MDNNKFEALAFEIYSWCKNNDLWDNCAIYYDDKVLSTSPNPRNINEQQIFDDLYEYENELEHTKSDMLYMTFSGVSIDYVMNGFDSTCIRLKEELCDIFKKYGYYYNIDLPYALSAHERNVEEN